MAASRKQDIQALQSLSQEFRKLAEQLEALAKKAERLRVTMHEVSEGDAKEVEELGTRSEKELKEAVRAMVEMSKAAKKYAQVQAMVYARGR